MERISRPELFMGLARLYAQRSTCERGQVGCVIVVGKDAVVAGYNGAPPGMDHCLDVGCDLSLGEEAGCQRIIHAEANAVAHAALRGIQIRDGMCFCTYSPCTKCAQLLVAAGVRHLFYEKGYRATPWDSLHEMGFKVIDSYAHFEEYMPNGY